MILGQLAAIGTSILFSFGSIMFTFSGRLIGSPLVNRMRLFIALIFVIGLHFLMTGTAFPTDAEPYRLFWLGLSGIIGLVLGDACLFQAFVMIGPRLSMLVMALAPVLGGVMAWLFLRETLTGLEVVGIAITMSGIIWVVSEQGTVRASIPPRTYLIGLLFAFGGASGQAGGLVASKLGLDGDFFALSGNLIRLTSATIVIWGFTLLRGQMISSFRRVAANRRALILMTGGAITGPVLGVWLSLIAVQRVEVGIASTLSSLMPVFLIPISWVVFGEKPTFRVIVGTIITFAGSVILFL